MANKKNTVRLICVSGSKEKKLSTISVTINGKKVEKSDVEKEKLLNQAPEIKEEKLIAEDMPVVEPVASSDPQDEEIAVEQPQAIDNESNDVELIVPEPVAEEVPIEEPVVEEIPVEEPVVDEAPVEVPVVEEIPVEEPVAEEAPVEEPVVDEAPIEEPVVDETPVEEPVAEEAPIEEPVVDEAPIEEPVAEEAPIEEPVVDEISVEEPVAEEAPIEEPVVDEAPVEEPVVDEAPIEEPVVEETPIEEPVVEEAPIEEPVVDEAPIEEPVAEETPVEEPVVDETPAEEPVAEKIPVEEPVVDEAPVEEPVAEEAPIEEPVVDEAPIEEPVAEETPVEEPAVEETPVEEPVVDEVPVEEPVVDEAPIEEPVAEETPAEEPVAEETPVEEPVVDEAPVEEPVAEEAPIEEPVAEEAPDALDMSGKSIKDEDSFETPALAIAPAVRNTPVTSSTAKTDAEGDGKNKKRGLSLTTKKALSGWLFVLPFVLGILFIYAPIVFDSIRFTFMDSTSLYSGSGLEFVGWSNYEYIFTKDEWFSLTIVDGLKDLILQIPAIVIFSLFMAIILNQKMRGRTVFRAIFFLPVILCTGIIDTIDTNSAFMSQIENTQGGIDDNTGADSGGIMSALDVEMLLSNIKLGGELVDIVTTLINNIFDIVSRSGVQMLIFLSGLQSISPAIYESCQVEGATAWETFWKITLPMISPMILVNAVYTVIDLFTAADNRVMSYIFGSQIYGKSMFAEAGAMAWVYIGIVLLFIVLVAILLKSVVFYQRRD